MEEVAPATDVSDAVVSVEVPVEKTVDEVVALTDVPGVAYAQPNYLHRLIDDAEEDSSEGGVSALSSDGGIGAFGRRSAMQRQGKIGDAHDCRTGTLEHEGPDVALDHESFGAPVRQYLVDGACSVSQGHVGQRLARRAGHGECPMRRLPHVDADAGFSCSYHDGVLFPCWLTA